MSPPVSPHLPLSRAQAQVPRIGHFAICNPQSRSASCTTGNTWSVKAVTLCAALGASMDWRAPCHWPPAPRRMRLEGESAVHVEYWSAAGAGILDRAGRRYVECSALHCCLYVCVYACLYSMPPLPLRVCSRCQTAQAPNPA